MSATFSYQLISNNQSKKQRVELIKGEGKWTALDELANSLTVMPARIEEKNALLMGDEIWIHMESEWGGFTLNYHYQEGIWIELDKESTLLEPILKTLAAHPDYEQVI